MIATTVSDMRTALRALPRPLGFVPTMGAIHAGHLSLVDRARRASASVAASIFVNPLQFGPNEDFERYPRMFEQDCAGLRAHGVDVIYAPSVEQMYPAGYATQIDVGAVASRYEGELRKGHFTGVATVVAKLLNIVAPDLLFMGQKDGQQTAVLRRMIADLDIPATMVVCPTVREADGLALSSRNVYLSPEERRAAPQLYRSLISVAQAIVRGATDRTALVRDAVAGISAPLRVAYFDIVDACFEPVDAARPPCVVIGSVWARDVRLLDNVTVPGSDGTDPLGVCG
jgi:pantoate--beta-alanine ligase